ncbi:MAG TPA: response regulator [Candidatus Sulfotelmatobacter sp.]|nr:response regulator [Candidatus Sulfotelmatobacter sp.]HWI59447.1 response regulator [Bacillota bacterium]
MMEAKRILVIEDDSAIRWGLVDALEFSGCEGVKLALRATCDLLLLDLILTGPSGFEILQTERESRAALPVIILTARSEENDRVRGLRLGADDYVVKPFSVRELLARVEAVLRPHRRPGPLRSAL